MPSSNSRDYISFKWLLLQCLPYTIVGAFMFAAVKMVGKVTGSGWISLGIQVFVGAVIYSILILLYMYFFKRETFENGVKEIKSRLKKEK